MEFDKKKCIELMKESKKLRQEGKFLWDFDKAKADELNKYLVLLSDDIFWNSRKKYLQILEFFVNKKITIDEFMHQFGQLRRSNLKTAKMCQKKLEAEAWTIASEIDFQLNPQSVGFTKIIGSIYAFIDLFDPDITLEMNLNHPELIGYGISEEFLRLDIKDNFLPLIAEYCKKS
jgi:hypothetical protein